METFWTTISRVFTEKVINTRSKKLGVTKYGHTLLHCGGCSKDVVLPFNHWCQPTPMQDINHWRCPHCVNRSRVAQGQTPLDRNGRAISAE